MKLEFLKSVPESGVYEEYCFNDTGATSWVLFETDELEKWAGAFGHGEHGISKIVTVDEFALVVVNGNGYIVNQNTKSVVRLVGFDYGGINSALATSNPNLIACSANDGFQVIKNGQIVANEWPDGIDGLELLNQDGSVLKGQMFMIGPHDYWNGISINLETFELEVQYDVRIDYWGIMGKKEEKNSRKGILDLIKSIFKVKKSA